LLIDPRVKLVYLKVDEELIRQRLQRRQGHFMNPALLESQFTMLEEPDDALWLDASRSPEEIVGTVRCRLQM
jgi:gluconokinase